MRRHWPALLVNLHEPEAEFDVAALFLLADTRATGSIPESFLDCAPDVDGCQNFQLRFGAGRYNGLLGGNACKPERPEAEAIQGDPASNLCAEAHKQNDQCSCANHDSARLPNTRVDDLLIQRNDRPQIDRPN